MTTCDLLVVGGGPAGAATATYAARAGLSVIVAERARFPREKACAEYLSPEAARDLAALGVLEEVERHAERLTGFRLVSDDGVAVLGRYLGAAARHPPYRPYGLALPRTVLDPIVLDAARAAGADVRESTACEDILLEDGRAAGGVLRRDAARERVRARAVVGADGLHSTVARQLGLARAGQPRRLALVAHFDGVAGNSDVGEMFAAPGWYVGLAPVGGGRTNVAMVVPDTDAPAIARDAEGFLLARLRTLPELAARIANARVARRVLVTGPFARRARRASADGAVLVGDAADFFDPFTGEGIFAALRGGRLAADTLLAALAAGDVSRRALAPYEAARRRQFRGKWMLERIVGLGAVRPALMRRFTHRLSRRQEVADLWVGAAGDFVPVGALFTPRRLAALI